MNTKTKYSGYAIPPAASATKFCRKTVLTPNTTAYKLLPKANQRAVDKVLAKVPDYLLAKGLVDEVIGLATRWQLDEAAVDLAIAMYK